MILVYFNVIISITKIEKIFNLLNNRDLLFKLKTLDTLFVYAYIIDYNILKIFVRHNLNKLITLLGK